MTHYPQARFALLATACLFTCFCCRLKAQSCVFSSPAGEPYNAPWEFQPQTRPVQGTPLKVVALGDSVVWGDGDKPENRIVWSVSQNLANDTGRRVELHSYAHSGARLQYYPPDTAATYPVNGDSPVSNVDSARPTTEEQAVCAKVNDSDADYVLMDGCINEIGATNIALPPTLGLNKTTQAEIRAMVLYYCAAPMRNVLEEVLTEFPKAKIVVLNYFLVVSINSEPKPESPAWMNAQKKKQQKEIERAVRRTETGMEEYDLTKAGIKQRAQAWLDNSKEFLDDTTSCFEWAIASATAGGQEPAIPQSPESRNPVCNAYKAGPTPPAQPGRIFLAKVSSNPNFSYGAPESHLWLLPIPLVFGFAINPDEMFRIRNGECNQTNFLRRGDSDCKVNPVAHPTPAGAQCYAKSIMSSLQMPWKPPAGESPVNCSDK